MGHHDARRCIQYKIEELDLYTLTPSTEVDFHEGLVQKRKILPGKIVNSYLQKGGIYSIVNTTRTYIIEHAVQVTYTTVYSMSTMWEAILFLKEKKSFAFPNLFWNRVPKADTIKYQITFNFVRTQHWYWILYIILAFAFFLSLSVASSPMGVRAVGWFTTLVIFWIILAALFYSSSKHFMYSHRSTSCIS